MRSFIGRDGFTWFVGVVEDRDDPIQLGRLRVRAFGYHTDNKGMIKTEDLPWAQVINGVQSASVNGLGFSPTGIVEGSWVIGFFMDGERAQEPVIMGTLPGIPSEVSDKTKGFNDPKGVYPLEDLINYSDVNRAARESKCEEHPARILKNANRLDDDGENEIVYSTATPPKIPSVAPDREDAYYNPVYWKEKPAADEYISEYPVNHTYETEGGHLQEFDDSPNKKRYHRFHPSGTYEEIINDGTRTVKIMGDDNEIVIKGKNMYIKGNLNVTVDGNKRELIKGNYHLEVEGETSFDLKSSWQTKVGHNQETEVVESRSTNIGVNDYLTLVTGNSIENVATGEKILNVKRDYSITTNEDYALTAFGNTQIFATGDYKLTNLGVHVVTSKGDMTIETPANVNETFGGNQTTQITGNLDVDAARIDLN